MNLPKLPSVRSSHVIGSFHEERVWSKSFQTCTALNTLVLAGLAVVALLMSDLDSSQESRDLINPTYVWTGAWLSLCVGCAAAYGIRSEQRSYVSFVMIATPLCTVLFWLYFAIYVQNDHGHHQSAVRSTTLAVCVFLTFSAVIIIVSGFRASSNFGRQRALKVGLNAPINQFKLERRREYVIASLWFVLAMQVSLSILVVGLKKAGRAQFAFDLFVSTILGIWNVMAVYRWIHPDDLRVCCDCAFSECSSVITTCVLNAIYTASYLVVRSLPKHRSIEKNNQVNPLQLSLVVASLLSTLGHLVWRYHRLTVIQETVRFHVDYDDHAPFAAADVGSDQPSADLPDSLVSYDL